MTECYDPLRWDPYEGERVRQLWLCVILQAVIDATTPPAATMDPTVGRSARARRARENHDNRRTRSWLLSPNEDFAFVCGMAGLHPDDVRKAAHRFIINRDRLHRMVERFGRGPTHDKGKGIRRRISQSAHGQISHPPRGYSKTFEHAEGTGQGTSKTHFEAGAAQ